MMATITPTLSTSSNCLPFHINDSGCDNADLELEKVLSRVADIQSRWSEEERLNRQKIGETRRQKLLALMQAKAA